jgi:hypothetical protein
MEAAADVDKARADVGFPIPFAARLRSDSEGAIWYARPVRSNWLTNQRPGKLSDRYRRAIAQ